VGFRVILYAAVAAHFAFMAFGVLGGFLAWRWPRLIGLQFLAAAWLVVIVVAHLSCPLTWIEDRARAHAGMAPRPGGFIANHIAGVFFPHGHQPAAMVVAGGVVLLSWIGFALRARRAARWRAARPRPRADNPSRSRRSSPDRAAPR
jgi:Protein of Unknown function (DUF2784)